MSEEIGKTGESHNVISKREDKPQTSVSENQDAARDFEVACLPTSIFYQVPNVADFCWRLPPLVDFLSSSELSLNLEVS